VGRWGVSKNAVHDAGLGCVQRDPILGGVLQCEEEPLGARQLREGDTGDYASGDVEAMAFRVACAAIKGRLPQS